MLALETFNFFKEFDTVPLEKCQRYQLLGGDRCGKCRKKINSNYCSGCNIRYNELGISE